MKFHSTLKDIVVSVLVLLSCTAAIWWGVSNLGMTDPSQSLAAYLLERIDGDGEVGVAIGGVGRNFLRTLTLNDVTITLHGEQVAHIEQVRIAGGVGRVALALLKRDIVLRITVDGLSGSLDDDSLLLFASLEPGAASEGVLDHLRLYITVNDADLAFTLPTLALHLSDGDFTAMFSGRFDAITLAGTGEELAIAAGGGQGRVAHVRYGIDEGGRMAVEADHAAWDGAGLQGQASDLVIAYQDHEALSFSASNLALSFDILDVRVPQVTTHATLSKGLLSDFAVSLSSLEADGGRWHLSSPAVVAGGSGEGRHTLVVASRSEEPFFFEDEELGRFSAHTMDGTFSYESLSAVEGELSLAFAQWDDQVGITDLAISLSALDTTSWDLSASGTGSLNAVLPLDYGTLESKFGATVALQQADQMLTTTIDLIDVKSSWLSSPIDLHLSVQGRGDEAQVEGQLSLSDQVDLSALYNQGDGERSLSVSGRLTDLRAGTFRKLLEEYAPFLKPYVHDDTRLSGNISFGASDVLGWRQGRISGDLALLTAHVGNFDVDAGFTLTGILDGQQLSVPSMTLATSGYRLAFSGETEVGYWLPRGKLSLYHTDDGQLLAHATMRDRPPASYEFFVQTAQEPVITIDGIVGRQTTDSITGQGVFSLLGDEVPFTFDLATDTLDLSIVQQDRLLLRASLAPPQTLLVEARSFAVPGSSASVSGTVEARYASLSDWSASSPDLRIDSITIANRRYSLAAPFSATGSAISIPAFTITDEGGSASGSLSYTGYDLARLKSVGFVAPYEATLKIENLVELSLICDERAVEVVATVKELPIARFIDRIEEASLSFSLVGTTDLANTMNFDGSVAYRGKTSDVSSLLHFDERHLELLDFSYQRGELTFEGEDLLFDSGTIRASGIFEHVRHLSYIDQRSHLAVSLEMALPTIETLFDLAKRARGLADENLTASLTIADILLYGEGGIADGTYQIGWKDGKVSAKSDLFSLSYDVKSSHIAVDAKPQFGIGLSAYGSLAADDFGIVVKDIHFPLTMLNRTFLKPIFLFKSGVGEGEVYLGGSRDAIRPYGQLFVNATEMFVFWLPDDEIHMKGVSVTIDGNRATTGRVPFFSTNTATDRTVHGFGNLSAHFDGLELLNYEIHIDDVDHPVFIWIPMAGYEVDIKGYVQGTFNLFGIGFETWLDGDVTISDMTMTLGIRGLPHWYEPAFLTTTRFNVTTAKGVNFFYPNTPNPFIRATLTENQTFTFLYDHLADEFEVDGVFAFRSGEIYYFQKNFFITEGSMVLHTDAISGHNAIIPRINLRAKVTDFDRVGNRVDIFLVLRDSTLTSLNPYFESIPAKEVNEIMEILGQSILPTGAYGEIGLYSVASLAAAATDVAERLGLLEVSQTTLLTETIRISLGLDMFSIRSNIVQNILFDALPVTGVMGSLSPIARYLHNTSIFMGKYIGTNFFLQALVHLSAMERSKVTSSFLSPDLSIDLELSLDWENPLATISFFTQPSELSFTNILDTMGFSVTKRIVLR